MKRHSTQKESKDKVQEVRDRPSPVDTLVCPSDSAVNREYSAEELHLLPASLTFALKAAKILLLWPTGQGCHALGNDDLEEEGVSQGSEIQILSRVILLR